MKLSSEHQALLQQLKDLDHEHAQLQIQLDNLEEKQALDFHKETLEEVLEEGTTVLEQKREIDQAVKKLEKDIGVMEADRRSADALLYSGKISSEKQVQAIKDELADIRKRKNKLEEEQLTAMEEQETINESFAVLVERRQELEPQIESLQAKYNEVANDLLGQRKAKQQEIMVVLRQLPKAFIDIYRSMRKNYTYGPITSLEDGMCLGCNMQLSLIDVQDIKDDIERGHLTYCPQCSIMII